MDLTIAGAQMSTFCMCLLVKFANVSIIYRVPSMKETWTKSKHGTESYWIHHSNFGAKVAHWYHQISNVFV